MTETDPEKLHILEPIAYNVDSNGERAFPNQRTAFYAQKGDLEEPEKVHTLDPKIAREHTTFYDKKNGLWRENNLVQVSPIGKANYDPWVYEFSHDAMGPYANHVKKQTKDIAEPKMEENVHAFANDNVDVLPYIRKE